MPAVNWNSFEQLPGDNAKNFELLCRALIRRHYGQFGNFRYLANQPGIEFHLKLHTTCLLGEPARWYGWQCKWYDLPSGRAIGTTRRRKIEEAITITERLLPELTDWVLWTRYPLTEGDQNWFYNLETTMKLHLWTASEVEEHLSGPAEILRGTYFGEMVLTPDILHEKHTEMIERIRGRWLPAVHQIVDAERSLRRLLGEEEAWAGLLDVADRLQNSAAAVREGMFSLPETLEKEVNKLVESSTGLANALKQTHINLADGDYEVLRQELTGQHDRNSEWSIIVRRLRAARHPIALSATNIVADINTAYKLLNDLHQIFDSRLIAVVAEAGFGKTQLSAQLTAPKNDRPAGILLYGRNLAVRSSLNELATRIVINGNPIPSFEKLLAAVDAAGQRASRRLPVVIDGLNEAEDPRDWKDQLAALSVTLNKYPYVLVVCTLRSDFFEEAVPNEIERLEITGFEHDINDAVRRYFQHYRIDPSDAMLPWELLDHPLTLRMFCEVTNPKRERTAGVESMPGSLTSLFERYLDQVAERIAELSPRSHRYYESDVRTALNKIGLYLWEMKARSLDLVEFRRNLGDDGRPWDQSIVRAFEQEGILFRVSDHHLGPNHTTVVYDALAGHLIADALIGNYGGQQFASWLSNPGTISLLSEDLDQRHPLAIDIFRSLVGLVPHKMHRRQLWPLLDEPQRTKALYTAAWLDRLYLDSETVSQLAMLAVTVPSGQRDLFDRLWVTRSAQSHPLNAEFLDNVLRPMSISERDLRWSEWIRNRQTEVLEDLKWLEKRLRTEQHQNDRNKLRALWIMWTLTSTVRLLRDHATRTLYWFGFRYPQALFELTLNSLEINDPYVAERMLAACYGVSMSLWSDPHGDEVRRELPSFAAKLVIEMFVPGAKHSTRHILTRDYALGVIELATRVEPGCVPEDKACYIKPPFHHIPSSFPKPDDIGNTSISGAEGAIHMDFGNYTLGKLIPNRRNYDFDNPLYQEVRRQIEHRIVDLGYSNQFNKIDREIGNSSWRSQNRGTPKVDRYGKKYSWIAFFEMFGHRYDDEALPDWRLDRRPADVDIDPSFPEAARTWQPKLSDLFTEFSTEPQTWIKEGPAPNYNHLLEPETVDGLHGPWVLLHGYIEQSAKDDARRVFTILPGLFVDHKQVEKLQASFNTIEHPGSMAIPEPQEDYYTYAGEIPWSTQFGSTLRDLDGRALRDIQQAFDNYGGRGGIPVEVPAYKFVWESYHSALNQVSGIVVPAPALCEQLGLSNRQGEWDFYDRQGRVATIYREFKDDRDTFRSYVLYLRADLLKLYLIQTGQTLVWLQWGERGFEYRTSLKLDEDLRDLWIEHKHIHRCGIVME
ncbi:hypothetical protein QJQ58_09635 [Paenibacillus dendritiformis]|uniref:NACHT domain-containing protein n=1 Tax=Paenibacillus dendritiformis TaxID=130049 RepID=UPI00248B0067|nr:hypothetical protein [Paenibacillus dendritiformis]WGU96467.1 hypothetical protein QJQ58_09635 [Paenibacillus dendritiformis]